MARIISIVNQKGGTGKSACTANLAVGLAQKNKKVLIVDADPQSDVSAGFGYRDCDDSNETLTALMDAVMKDEDIPSDCYIRHQAEGIDIICSNIGLAGTEVQLVNAMSREYVLKQILYGILYIHQGPPVTPRGLSLVIKQQLIQLRILIPDLILTVLTECLVWPI